MAGIAIHGFGRIGRSTLKAALRDERFVPVSVSDIRALAHPILRHRIITNFYAESERVDSDGIITRLLEAVPVPRSAL